MQGCGVKSDNDVVTQQELHSNVVFVTNFPGCLYSRTCVNAAGDQRPWGKRVSSRPPFKQGGGGSGRGTFRDPPTHSQKPHPPPL